MKQKFDQETGPKHDKTGGVFAGFMKPDMLAADGAKSYMLSADGRNGANFAAERVKGA